MKAIGQELEGFRGDGRDRVLLYRVFVNNEATADDLQTLARNIVSMAEERSGPGAGSDLAQRLSDVRPPMVLQEPGPDDQLTALSRARLACTVCRSSPEYCSDHRVEILPQPVG